MIKTKLSVIILIAGAFLLSCGNKHSKDTSSNSSEKVERSEKTIKEERYGSDLVGYVTKPEDWKYFNDENASPNAKQLSVTPFDIVTLDILSTDNQATAEELRDRSYESYITERGVPKENITKEDITVGNFKGKGFTIKIPDGREVKVNLIDYNGNVYFVSQEGMPEKSEELKKVVNTWRPDK